MVYSNSQLTEMLTNKLKPTYSLNLLNDINIQNSVDLNKYNFFIKTYKPFSRQMLIKCNSYFSIVECKCKIYLGCNNELF